MRLILIFACASLLIPSAAVAQVAAAPKAARSKDGDRSTKKPATKKEKTRAESDREKSTNSADASLPEIAISRDNIAIDKSVRIKRGTYIVADRDRNGVVQITADNIVVDFQGAALAGVASPQSADKEQFFGFGVNINGHKNVVIKNARIYGYHCNVNAQNCDRLTVENVDAGHSRGQRIGRSGREIHIFLDLRNIDAWRNYGSGIWLEKCSDSTVTGCRASYSQNGILLAFCERCTVHNNDASFNSGWGIGLWASNDNVVSWNLADFVNRPGAPMWGQDSAGIAIANDAHRNVVVGNSMTYGGDGLFLTDGANQGVRPCNDNVFAWNDGSWSTNNAFEGTFSERNIYYKNIASDSRYGFWLGYSSNSLVIDNLVERSSVDGIAIEHGAYNRIERNTVNDTRQVAMHLWANPTPAVFSRHYVVTENVIQRAGAAFSLERTTNYFIDGNKIVAAPIAPGLASSGQDRGQPAIEMYEGLPSAKRVAEIVKTKPKNFKLFREQSRRQGPDLLQLADFAPRDIRGK
jgi:parallel beta-helix repeat protein